VGAQQVAGLHFLSALQRGHAHADVRELGGCAVHDGQRHAGDEDVALDAATILLAFGAAPAATNADGESPDRAAAKRGLEDAAELIREAGGRE